MDNEGKHNRVQHDYQTETGCPYLKLQHQVHPLLAQWVDVVEDQSDDDVDTVAFMSGDAVLTKKQTGNFLHSSLGLM